MHTLGIEDKQNIKLIQESSRPYTWFRQNYQDLTLLSKVIKL